MSARCKQCGARGEGRFCASCGAPLKPLACRKCGTSLEAGTRFCTQCGTATGGGAAAKVGRGAAPEPRVAAPVSERARNSVWWVSGGLLAVVAAVVLVTEFSRAASDAPAVPSTVVTSTPGAGPPDLASMTPREAADRLFDRVMGALEANDTLQATSFLPMALQAYGLAEPLDEDGLFHRSLLEAAAGELEAALATAEEGLARNPDHLLNLYAAAQAAQAAGQVEAAREHYARMLAAWSTEVVAGRTEYDEHSQLLPVMRDQAEGFLSGAGP